MICGYCQHSNSEEDHRCRRCSRRLTGTAQAAPAHLAAEHVRVAVKALGAHSLTRASGANALARAPEPQSFAEEFSERIAAPAGQRRPARNILIDSAATADSLPRPRAASQPSLFGAEFQPKIIPFETLPRAASSPHATPRPLDIPEALAPRQALRIAPPAVKPARKPAPDESQATLDFLPPLKNAPRTLKTNAEAVIFCDAHVAAPAVRAIAASLDFSMVMVAFGALLIIFQTWAKPIGLDRFAFLALAAMLGLTAMFYGLLFTVCGTVTPGMRWTDLRLINFDGFPPDGRSRALRFAGSWISVLSGGLGVLWALLDEEKLTWHDHMSKTFPTGRESNSILVRHRR